MDRVSGLRIVGMSAGTEEVGSAREVSEGVGHPLRSRSARARPLTLREGDGMGSRLRGNDGRLGGNDVGGGEGDGGLLFRFWDFWVRRSWLLWVLAVVVLFLDQGTKWVIEGWLFWGESWPADGFLRFTHARNTGAAFSLLQGHSNILSVVALFAVALLLWVYATTGARSWVLRVALGLQLGGALGNLLDRLMQGYVTDFLDVGPWPIFNVADSAISVGMVLMVWYFFSHREEEGVGVAGESAEGCARCAEARRYGGR